MGHRGGGHNNGRFGRPGFNNNNNINNNMNNNHNNNQPFHPNENFNPQNQHPMDFNPMMRGGQMMGMRPDFHPQMPPNGFGGNQGGGNLPFQGRPMMGMRSPPFDPKPPQMYGNSGGPRPFGPTMNNGPQQHFGPPRFQGCNRPNLPPQVGFNMPMPGGPQLPQQSPRQMGAFNRMPMPPQFGPPRQMGPYPSHNNPQLPPIQQQPNLQPPPMNQPPVPPLMAQNPAPVIARKVLINPNFKGGVQAAKSKLYLFIFVFLGK